MNKIQTLNENEINSLKIALEKIKTKIDRHHKNISLNSLVGVQSKNEYKSQWNDHLNKLMIAYDVLMTVIYSCERSDHTLEDLNALRFNRWKWKNVSELPDSFYRKGLKESLFILDQKIDSESISAIRKILWILGENTPTSTSVSGG